MSATHKVRVSQDPTKEIEVDESEYTDLLRQGLLVTAKGEPTAETRKVLGEPTGAGQATPTTTKKES